MKTIGIVTVVVVAFISLFVIWPQYGLDEKAIEAVSKWRFPG